MATAAKTGPPSSERLDVDGAVDTLRRSLGVLKQAPGVVVLMVVVAPFNAYLGAVGSLVAFVAQAGAVAYMASVLPAVADPERRVDNSLPVRMLILFVTGILLLVAVLVGLLLLVVPGLYLLVRFHLVTPAVILDDHGPFEALAASWDLTHGNVLTVAGVLVAVFAAGSLVGVGVLLLAAGGVDPAIQRVVEGETQSALAVSGAVTSPVGVAVMFVLYEGLER